MDKTTPVGWMATWPSKKKSRSIYRIVILGSQFDAFGQNPVTALSAPPAIHFFGKRSRETTLSTTDMGIFSTLRPMLGAARTALGGDFQLFAAIRYGGLGWQYRHKYLGF
ncbi:hypothetical protein [Comamonas sp. B-9]|uniref:hypothetical protein n=1 Tax=Comamonas sp. B-9 TaxID=1055192 RepID=UPI0011DC8245|nr:hypothetical protein [Comamonas sp. B-9]